MYLVINTSLQSEVTIVIHYRLDDLGSATRQEQEIFLFPTMTRLVLQTIQPLIQRKLGVISLGVKQPGREADHPSPSCAELKNMSAVIHLPPSCLNGMDSYNLTFVLHSIINCFF
jgi:hypothetical protein